MKQAQLLRGLAVLPVVAALAVPAAAQADSDSRTWWSGATITKTTTAGATTVDRCAGGYGAGLSWSDACRNWLIGFRASRDWRPDASGLATSVTESDVTITGPEKRPGGGLAARDADIDGFDPAKLRPGSFASYALEGARYAPGTTLLARELDLTNRRQRVSHPAAGVTVYESGSDCDPVAGTCVPIAIDRARELAADPSQGEPGHLYRYYMEASKQRASAKRAKAARKAGR